MRYNDKKKHVLLWRIIKSMILIAPFIIGMIGFLLEGFSYPDAAYSSLQLYFANISARAEDGSYHWFIEIGRWTAPIVSVAIGISVVIEVINGELWPRLWCKVPSSYVVYGDVDRIKMFCPGASNPFSKYCIVNNRRYVWCRKYILLFDLDKDNLDLYSDILMPQISDRKNVKVYMNVIDMEQQDIQDANLITFQVNEYIASQFYKNHDWTDYMRSFSDKICICKVALIGFDDLGIKMLEAGLSLNIVSVNQNIEYHVWGENEKYRAMHSWMSGDKITPDRLIFHDKHWFSEMKNIETMDCIILCDNQNKNIEVLSDLLRLTNISGQESRVYVYTDMPEALKIFQIRHYSVSSKNDKKKQFIVGERLKSFYIPNDGRFLQNILMNDEDISREAKIKHENYIEKARKYAPDYIYYEWSDLNAFLRWENEMSASLDNIRKYLKEKYAIEDDEYKEIEHIRWMRSHYINGWAYSETRNDSLKMHPDMKAFVELSEEEKEKDDNTIKG